MRAISRFNGLRFPSWSVPAALFVLCVLTYGLLIPFMGLYQDDRYMAWFAQAFGPRVFIPFFANERPFLGYLYMLSSALVQGSALGWHLFALTTRWLSSVAAWWMLRQLWPKRGEVAAWTAFLLTVYPGFQQHFAVMGYGHFYLRLASLLFSFGLTIRVTRGTARTLLLTAGALFFAGIGYIPSEYLFAMEFLRPALIWLVLGEQNFSWRKRLWRTLQIWLPYLALMAAFLIWRIFIFQFPTYQPVLAQELVLNPLQTFLTLTRTILWDAVEAAFLVWDLTWHPFTLGEEMGASVWVSLGLALLTAGCAALYLYRLRENGDQTGERWYRSAISIGGLSLLWVGIPFWFVGLQVELEFPYDRVTLPFMFSASLLWVGLVCWLTRYRLQRILLVSAAVGLAVGAHFRLANSFRLAHENQRVLFAQFTWRVPDLEQGAIVLSNEIAMITFSGDNAFTATLNWLYDPEPFYPELPYVWLYVPQRVGTTLPSLEPGLSIVKPFRSLKFKSSTEKTLVFYYSPPGCLRLIDPEIDSHFLEYPLAFTAAIKLSQPERVISLENPAVKENFQELFSEEPERGWCYFFEKADLARQEGNWEEVVRLGELALKLPRSLQTEKELLPFIEGYAHYGNWEKAYTLSNRVFRTSPKVVGMLCAVWERIDRQTRVSQEKQAMIAQVDQNLGCGGI